MLINIHLLVTNVLFIVPFSRDNLFISQEGIIIEISKCLIKVASL